MGHYLEFWCEEQAQGEAPLFHWQLKHDDNGEDVLAESSIGLSLGDNDYRMKRLGQYFTEASEDIRSRV